MRLFEPGLIQPVSACQSFARFPKTRSPRSRSPRRRSPRRLRIQVVIQVVGVQELGARDLGFPHTPVFQEFLGFPRVLATNSRRQRCATMPRASLPLRAEAPPRHRPPSDAGPDAANTHLPSRTFTPPHAVSGQPIPCVRSVPSGG